MPMPIPILWLQLTLVDTEELPQLGRSFAGPKSVVVTAPRPEWDLGESVYDMLQSLWPQYSCPSPCRAACR